MDIANDLFAGLNGGNASGIRAGESRGFDWQGLHARLCAAHAARQVLGNGESPARILGGGFSDWTRVSGHETEASRGVNLIDSTDGKEPQGIAVIAAGHIGSGG
jgi:hypothetical protein